MDSHILSYSSDEQIAEDLQLRDTQVVEALSQLLRDFCWKVKAHAVKGPTESMPVLLAINFSVSSGFLNMHSEAVL